MEYFFYATKAWCKLDRLNKYIVNSYKNGMVAEIHFDDSVYNDFANNLGLQEFIDHNEEISAFGKDGFIYSLTLSGTVRKREYQSNFPKLICKSQYENFKRFNKVFQFKEQALKKYASHKIINKGLGIYGFNKYLYINKDHDYVMPFRFKKAKKENQPLVVYLGGGGTVGCDNNKLLHEFLCYAKGKSVNKFDCNVLLPQITGGGSFETECRKIFACNTAELIRELLKDYDIDSDRVYVYGTSLGGGCVWNILLDSPDLFACALEAMGCYFGYESLDENKFKEIAEIPIWMTHASDDVAVEIASDDYFYAKLKEYGADVKYSRWDKYGHKMSYKFYRQEPWLEWMFSHNKEK